MSIHPNPDGSNTEGTKVEAPGKFVGHASLVTLTTAIGIGAQGSGGLISVAQAVTAGATQAICSNPGSTTATYRLDGVAPTVSVGAAIPAGGSVILNMTDAAAALFFGASTAQIFVTYTM